MSIFNLIDRNVWDQFLQINTDLSRWDQARKLRQIERILSIPGTEFKCPARNKKRATFQLSEQVMLSANLCAKVVREQGFFFTQPPISLNTDVGYCAGASAVVARAILHGHPLSGIENLLPEYRVPDEGAVIQAEYEGLNESQNHEQFLSLMCAWTRYLRTKLVDPIQAQLMLESMLARYQNTGIQEFLEARMRNELPLDSLASRTFIESAEQLIHFGCDRITDPIEQLQSLINGTLPSETPRHPFVQQIAEVIGACPTEINWRQWIIERLLLPDCPLFFRYLASLALSLLDESYFDEASLRAVLAEHGLCIGENIAPTRERFNSISLSPGVYLVGLPVTQGAGTHLTTLCIGEVEGFFYDSNLGVFRFPSSSYLELFSTIQQIYDSGAPEENPNRWMIYPCSIN